MAPNDPTTTALDIIAPFFTLDDDGWCGLRDPYGGYGCGGYGGPGDPPSNYAPCRCPRGPARSALAALYQDLYRRARINDLAIGVVVPAAVDFATLVRHIVQQVGRESMRDDALRLLDAVDAFIAEQAKGEEHG